jgi:hypothetical protein
MGKFAYRLTASTAALTCLCARLPTMLFSIVSNTPSHASSRKRGATPAAGKKAMLGRHVTGVAVAEGART